MESIPRFYVYVLCRPNGSPFYVGKGQGNRIDAHESFARNGYKAKRYSIIRKIWREGGSVFKQKIYYTDDEDTAYAIEQAAIAAIGREYLANETDGGDGNHGYRPTDEVKARISKAQTGRKLSDRWKANVQAAKIGKPRSEACKAKLRAAFTGRKRTAEEIEKSAIPQRGRPWSEKARQNIVAGIRNSKKVRPHGEAHHRSKWTDAQVIEVRNLYKSGIGPSQISRQTGIPLGTVRDFCRGSIRKRLASDDGNIP